MSGNIDSLPGPVSQQLLLRGYLTEESEADEIQWLGGVIDRIEEVAGPDVAPRTYCFVTTYRCNLACSYCFQSNESLRTVTNRMLTLAQAEAGLAVMRSDIASGKPGSDIRNPVLLFGGEPLMPNQRPVVERIVLACELMGFPVSATSNGVFLQQYEDLLGPSRIGHFQISLDGPPEIHNRRRIPLNGRPTFDQIWSNICLALDKGCRVDLRCNLDSRNLDGFADLVDFVADQGYLEHENLTLRYARVVPDFDSKDGSRDIALEWADIENHLARQAVDRPNLRKVPQPSDIETFEKWVAEKFPQKTTRHCGAVRGNVYFGPDDEVYNCHETVGRVELSIGRYVNGQVLYNDRAEKWVNRRPDRLTACSKCPFVLSCAGGCTAHVDLDAEPLASNCANFAANFKAAVRRAYISTDDEQIFSLQHRSC